MKTQQYNNIIIIILLGLSCLVGFGGPTYAMISEQWLGWDLDVWNMGTLCFPAGMAAGFLTFLLQELVEKRMRH